jgi:hypothetical protein
VTRVGRRRDWGAERRPLRRDQRGGSAASNLRGRRLERWSAPPAWSVGLAWLRVVGRPSVAALQARGCDNRLANQRLQLTARRLVVRVAQGRRLRTLFLSCAVAGRFVVGSPAGGS